MKVTIGHTAVILKEALHMENTLRSYELIIRSNDTNWSLHQLTKLIGFIMKIFIPRLSRKLMQIIEKSMDIMNRDKIQIYLQSSSSEFLSYWDKKRTKDESTGKHFLVLLSCDSIADIFKHNIFPLKLEVLFLSNISTVILNGLVNCLLDCILEVHTLFDESGVYRLFRIILHLQEYAMSIKAILQPIQTSSPFKLLSSSMAWRRAELALAALNEQIFAGRQGEDRTKSRTGRIKVKIGQLSPSPDELMSPRGVEKSSQRNCFMLGSFLMGASRQGNQQSRDAVDEEDDGGVPFSEEGKGVGGGGAPDKRLPAVSASQPPAAADPSDLSLLLMPMEQVAFGEDERSRWAALAAQKSSVLSMQRWNWNPRIWRRVHRGTVFVELKIDVSDI